MPEPTPGPWRIVKRTEEKLGQARWQIEETTGTHPYWIAQVINEADARLIAAAPDLLRELENLFAMVQGEVPSLLEDHHSYDSIRAAIAKAIGKELSLPKHSTTNRRKR